MIFYRRDITSPNKQCQKL